MTAHPIDTEGFRGKHQVSDDEWADDIEHLEWALAEAVGRAEAAEHRAIRAETRIKAVRALHVKEPGVGTAYCIDCEQTLPRDTIRALTA